MHAAAGGTVELLAEALNNYLVEKDDPHAGLEWQGRTRRRDRGATPSETLNGFLFLRLFPQGTIPNL
jgi:hypothetical protein